MSDNFTPAQRMAIDVRDRNLLVSAGAGAGKTSTLIERLYTILLEPHACSLDELLVVTFTRAAAQEMRTRLQERLTRAMLDEPPGSPRREWLQAQLMGIPQARISTIHSFCLQVITENAEKIGLAPSFMLVSEGERLLAQRHFLQQKLDELMAGDSPDALLVRELLRYNKVTSAVETLLGWVMDFHGFLESLPNPEQWVEGAISADRWSPDDPRCRTLWQQRIRAELAGVLCALDSFAPLRGLDLPAGLAIQAAEIENLRLMLEQAMAGEASIDPGVMGPRLELPRLSTPKGLELTEGQEAFKEQRVKLTKRLTEARKRLDALSAFREIHLEERSRAILAMFAERLGLTWHQEHFEQQVVSGRLTFAHLERLAHRVLLATDDTPTIAALQYRQSFRHVFVDEFQDVNQLQESILRAVARPPEDGEGGNFFAVGDVKQSIYEFRQAEPSLFLNLLDRSTDCDPASFAALDARIMLQHNFRSDKRLLEALNGLFDALMLPGTLGINYAASHRLIAGRKAAHEARAPFFRFSLLPTADEFPEKWDHFISHEAAFVAQAILSIGPPWRDICILVRTAKGRITDLYEALTQAGIPVYTSNRSGFLTAIEVIEFQAILRTIDNPLQDLDLLGALRGPAFQWGDAELLLLRTISREGLFFQNLQAAAGDTDSPIHHKAAHALGSIRRWQILAGNLPMQELFARLYDELDLLEIARVRPAGEQRRRNLEALLDRAGEFDGFQRKGLSRFLEFLDQLIDEGRDLATPAVLPAGADMVQIMTIHAAKGMEFPVIVLPFVGSQFNDQGRRRPILWDRHTGMATGIGLQDDDEGTDTTAAELPFRLLQGERRRRETCEELRLLYVALTRAREAIHIIGSCKRKDRALLCESPESHLRPESIITATSYLEWLLPWAALHSDAANPYILEMEEVPPEAISPPEPGAAPVPSTVASARPDDYLAAAERIREVESRAKAPLLRAKLSVTEAKRAWDATRDPETPPFREAASSSPDTEWIPASLRPGAEPSSSPVEGRQLGTLTHRFLANMQLEPMGGTIRLSEELRRQVEEGFLTADESESIRLADIAWFLETPIGHRVLQTRGRLERERPFTTAIDGFRLHPAAAGRTMILQGVIDLLFRDGDGWVIVDYKTDRVNSIQRLEELTASYGIQMRLYRLLIETALGQPVREAHLVFLRGREVVEVALDDEAISWTEVLAESAVLFTEVDALDPVARWV